MVSFGDTWEWDPGTHSWSQLQPTASPGVRHDLGLVWDSSRNKAVLFGGMQKDTAGVDGIPMQDTWEWDPTAGTWTERTTQGNKPSPRYAHSMAFAGAIKKAIVFGGWDISTGGSLDDLWEWDPVSGSWTARWDGTETNTPLPRMYASLVSDDAKARLELMAGATSSNMYYGTGGMGGIPISPPGMPSPYGWQGTREVWEIDTTTYACQDRSAPSNTPLPRSNHALAYNPSTGKTYVFGGIDSMQNAFDDLWEWDGKTWTEVVTDVRPSARSDAGLAYDPARKSLILYGGQSYSMGGMYYQTALGDTWEWSSTTRQWTQLSPKSSPDPLYSHGMVTDTTRNKILLFAGMSNYTDYVLPPDPNMPSGYKDPMRNDVWEWDGSTMTWTNRTSVVGTNAPSPRQYPILAYDQARQKLFVEETSMLGYYGSSGSNSTFWEWDPVSAGWAMHTTSDYLDYGTPYCASYDSTRRREVIFGDVWSQTTGNHETWELDAKGPTWYVRSIVDSPSAGYGIAMAFDSARGVVVLFGGNANGTPLDETWEYSVTGLGNGEGCSSSTASTCTSGNCVEGVCCESASCAGPCKSCNVSGHEGTCVLAQAGTEVPGSCSSGQACDASGNCKTNNGQACSSASACASGFCVDGVCCNSACNGMCVSCNQAGLAGKCSPYAVGTDPEKECSKGSGTSCESTCDGVGACEFPPYGSSCGSCEVCDGAGSCSITDPSCYPYGTGGYGGYGGSTGYGGYGGTTSRGGSTGYGGSSYAGSTGYGGTSSYGGVTGYGGTSSYGGVTGYAGVTGYGGVTGSGGVTASPGGALGGGTSSGGQSTTGHLTRAGCTCALGNTTPPGPGPETFFFLAGVAVFLRRIRRRLLVPLDDCAVADVAADCRERLGDGPGPEHVGAVAVHFVTSRTGVCVEAPGSTGEFNQAGRFLVIAPARPVIGADEIPGTIQTG